MPTDQEDQTRDAPSHDEVYRANITVRADEVTICSISPLTVGETALDTEWIAAREDSFVALEAVR